MKLAIIALITLLMGPVIYFFKKMKDHQNILENREKDRTGIK